VPGWLHLPIAILIGISIAVIGLKAIRMVSSNPVERRDAPEDVEDLEVFFVCGECGTEFRVTRLGELQVPRHCGERMQVVRRPAGAV
jgi:hypothetical protein